MAKEDNFSLKDSFTRIMQSRILSGELKVGDKLPPERELAETMGLSRGSVNQGLLDLERLGFIKIEPRRGSYVADFMHSSSPELLSVIMTYDSALIDRALFRDLMEMRTLVERESVRLACKRVGAAEVSKLNELMNTIYSADSEEVCEALFNLHYYFTVSSGNRAYALLFRSFEKMVRSFIELHYSEPAELRRALPLYNGLCSAVSLGDSAAADELITTILRSATEYLDKRI